jgi:hypothetical protein
VSTETEHVMEQLAWMRHLPANWDSYGAKMIDRGAINKAQALASKLVGPWDACPVHDGSVQLEQHADGYDIEIVISNANQQPANGVAK